jgi:uncharacterized protein YjbJ (UPF0337 family)
VHRPGGVPANIKLYSKRHSRLREGKALTMNEINILESEWKDLREQIRQHWKALTAEDLDVINGNFDVLVDLLQEKYGYSKPLAEDDVKRFVREHHTEKMRS